MDTSREHATTDWWARLSGVVLCLAAGVVAGVSAAGPLPRQATVGLAVAGVAVAACVLPLWRLRREVRHLRALGEAHDRFAALVGRQSARDALAAAVEALVPRGRLVELHLGDAPPPAGIPGVLVADALETGLVAELPDGTTGRETARLVALPIAAGGERIGAAVLRLTGGTVGGSDDGVAAVRRLLGRVGSALAAATEAPQARTVPTDVPGPADTQDASDATGRTDATGPGDGTAAGDDELRRLVAEGAHDLRTPLNTLAGMAETLARHGEAMTPSSREELYGALQRSTRRVAGWINVLLDEAVDEQPRSRRRTPTALLPLLEEAVTVSHAATVGLRVELVPTALCVLADPGEVVRVVSNLLVNAGHHAGDGARVELEARPRGARVEVVVRDHGAGWGTRETGQEGADRTGRHRSGHGLGLESVRAHVRRWGGELELDETPGGGATVRFSLPRARRDDVVTEEQGWTIAGGEGLLRGMHRTSN